MDKLKRIKAIEKEIKDLDQVSTNAYNNEGLFNEIRNMKEILDKELKQLKKEL